MPAASHSRLPLIPNLDCKIEASGPIGPYAVVCTLEFSRPPLIGLVLPKRPNLSFSTLQLSPTQASLAV